ncbi:hypothetical protein [Aliidiomarina soli]|uniref:Uncharacterized protein n=1 Tax=Aliidiomarina soli TaxID=1928574 RepID=A0A432WJ81_9GAMM|nr:hypothetical protein [Aliidiomarina soli]RUO33767.1 hypothetical protein CWE14_04695 [Aliidiomarina soli]
MIKKGILFLSALLVMAWIALMWSGNAYAEREVLTMEQREDAMAELEQKREQRREKIATIDDKDLVEALEAEEYVIYRNTRGSIQFDEEPTDYSYVDPIRASFIGPLGQRFAANRFERMEDYETPAALFEAYRSSFVVTTDSPQGQSFRLHEPFAFPFENQLQFTQLVMDDGEVKDLPDLLNWEARTAEIRYEPDEYYFLETRSENDAKPVKIIGEVAAELPLDVIQFEFQASDLGQTKSQRGYSVTLVQLNEFNYEIEVEIPDDQVMRFRDQDIVGEAMALNERELARQMSTWIQADYDDQMSDWIDDIIERALRGEVDADTVNNEGYEKFVELSVAQGTTLRKAFAFMGPIDVARVTLLPRAQTEEKVSHALEFPIHFVGRSQLAGELDLDTLPQINVQGTVYDQWSSLRTDLTAEDMQQLIDVRYQKVRPYSPGGYNHTEQLHLRYPKVQSDMFISRSERYAFDQKSQEQRNLLKGMVHFFNRAGEEIEQTRDKDELFSFTRSGLNYTPQYMPQWPTHLQATIPVITAPNIVKENYNADNLPAGMHLDDNRLTVDYEVFTPREELNGSLLETELRNRFFARDAEQRYIKGVSPVVVREREAGEPVHVFYFLGQPASIEIWYRGDIQDIDYEMDVELREESEENRVRSMQNLL